MKQGKASWATNRERMTSLVERWRSSGETAAGFARRYGISAPKFQYWRDRLKGKPRGGPAGDSVVGFAPVHVVPTSVGEGLDIVLASGDRLHVGRDVGVDVLWTAIVALRERC